MKRKLLFITVLFATIAVIVNVFNINIPFLNIFNKRIVEKKDGALNNKIYIFTKDTLKDFNGIINKSLYLSILGDVYDVSKGDKYYGPGQTYHVFTGKDASKSFITGNFEEDSVSDNVADLTPEELLSLKKWKSFYDEQYIKKGVLVGRYYDANGKPTEYSIIIEDLIKNAEKTKNQSNLDEQLYPPCNIEWSAESGTRVWCTKQSGGITRDWIGVPRKYYKPGLTNYRCACVLNTSEEENKKFHQYENCNHDSISCNIPN